jgi:uncharacterized protein (TIGR02145 family)
MRRLIILSFIVINTLVFAQSKSQKIYSLERQRDSLLIHINKLETVSLELKNELRIYKEESQKQILALKQENKYLKGTKIADNYWLPFNLDVVTFRNGDSIPQAQSDEAWQNAGFNNQPAWCYYESNGVIYTKFGKLYNKYALSDPRGIAPKGWKVASVGDWSSLESILMRSDYLFENLITSYSDTVENSFFTGLNFELAGWRDVGCGGLGSDVTFWAVPDYQIIQDEAPTVGLSNTVNEHKYFRDYKKSIFHFGETSWIMGHYIRCVKE